MGNRANCKRQRQPVLQYIPANMLFIIKRGLSNIRAVEGRKHEWVFPGIDRVLMKLPLGPQRTSTTVERLNTSEHDDIQTITASIDYHLDRDGWKRLRNMPNRARLYNEAAEQLGVNGSETGVNLACHEHVFASLIRQEFDRLLRKIVSSNPCYAKDIERSRGLHQFDKSNCSTREELTRAVRDALQEALDRWGLAIDNVSITYIDFNDTEMWQEANNKLIQAQYEADMEEMKGKARNARIVDLYTSLKKTIPEVTIHDVILLLGMEHMGPTAAYTVPFLSANMGQHRSSSTSSPYNVQEMDEMIFAPRHRSSESDSAPRHRSNENDSALRHRSNDNGNKHRSNDNGNKHRSNSDNNGNQSSIKDNRRKEEISEK